MATLSAKVFKHHKKADGTYNVKICVSHKEQRVFIDTTHFVSVKQLTKDLKIKDPIILSIINRTLDDYRKSISELNDRLETYSADALKQFLIKKDEKVDFLNFCQIHIDQMGKDGRTKSMANYKTVRNSLKDFLGNRNSLLIDYITVDFINRYERFLKQERLMVRIDRLGREYKIIGKPLPDSSVHIYLRDFQGFFSAAMAYYNKPSLGLIPIKYNPFMEYKIVEAPETEKRSLEITEIVAIRDCKTVKDSRAELAKNLSMLSFYLCGMNAVDFYNKAYEVKSGRIEYLRSKTRGKRKDKAFISIKIPSEAVLLLHFAGNLKNRYSSITNLNAALSKGMSALSLLTGIPELQFYKLRHSFGNHARNTCRKSKDDVALALNHVDHGRKTTDIYLARDWTIVDEVQSAVIDLIRDKPKFLSKCKIEHFNNILSYIQLPLLNA